MFKREVERSNFPKFLTGALVGGLIGSAAALLLAPKKGNELINDLRDAYDDVSKNVGLRNKREPKISKTVMGTVAGGLMSIAAAIWLAQQDKNKIRKNLSNAYSQMRGQASRYMQEGENLFDEANEYVEGFTKKMGRGRSNQRTASSNQTHHRHPLRLKRK